MPLSSFDFSMRALFITNPASGHIRRNPGISSQITRFISNSLPGAECALTTHRGHATELAAAAAQAGVSLVIAVGGDGTVNEVASGLLGTNCHLGIIPLGSGNGLARELKVPLPIASALRNLLSGRPRPIDGGLVNGHPFFCTSGTGFDAHVVHRFNARLKRGFSAYVSEGLRAWRLYQPSNYSILADGRSLGECKALFVTVANASQFGNNVRIAPRARPDDGLLDLVIVRPQSTAQALLTVLRLFSGRLAPSPYVQFHRASKFVLGAEATGFFHVDGEVHPLAGNLEFSISQRSIAVLAP